nr:CdiA family toxin C-terminal domain-containing protein [Paenibacillus curdlanolyticus]
MNQLIAFLGDAIQRYEHNEGEIDKLLSEIQDFREKRSAWDWIVDQAEYVGDKMKDAWNSIDDFIQDTLDLIQAYTSAMCEFIDQAMAAVNQGLDYLRDMAIASGKNSIEQYFLYGVLKGLVDTIGGVLKLVIELPLIIPQIVLTIEGYAIDVFMSEDPFEKIKDDILSLPDKAEAMLSSIKEAFIEIKTEFMNADANHKAEMIGFAVEKVLEIAIPGLKGLSLAKDIGLGAKTLSAFTRGGRSLFEGLSDNLITQAFKNSMEKLLDMEIRGFGDALALVGMDGFIPSGTTIREIFENLGLIRKSDAPELDGRMPEGTSLAKFSSNLEDHIKKVDPNVPRKRGIGGAHNKDEFMKNDVNILNVKKHDGMPGVEKITYQVPSLDAKTGQKTGWRAKPFDKTVYDPKVISDEEFIKRGKEAANNAASEGTLGREWEGYDSQGIKWRGYTDENGEVTSFYPEL